MIFFELSVFHESGILEQTKLGLLTTTASFTITIFCGKICYIYNIEMVLTLKSQLPLIPLKVSLRESLGGINYQKIPLCMYMIIGNVEHPTSM